MAFIKKHRYTIIFILVILVMVFYFGMKWYEARMNLVDRGLASSNFPYNTYSILELARQGKIGDLNDEDRAKFIQEIKDLPTRSTPQETFDKYIQALKDGDIEEAVSYMREESQEGERDFLNNAREEDRLQEIIEVLEEARLRISWNIDETEKIDIDYNYTCVSIDKPKGCGITFEKDLYGYWKIYRFY